MKILCTGGAGFIGSHLVDKLIENGHKVFIVDDFSGGKIENIHKSAISYAVDCREEDMVDTVFKDNKPEIVFHLACNAAENLSLYSPIDITSRNYDAFIKVLTSFIRHKGKRFVFVSSIAVYGKQQIPFQEAAEPKPEDLYGISKLACEQSLKVMSKVHEFEYVIARPHNVYGPRSNMKDPYRNVVMIWMNAILGKKPYYIYGDGKQLRAFSYVDDVVAALYKCGFEKAVGMTFNIGSDMFYSLNELANNFQYWLCIDQKPQYLPKRQQEVKEAIANHMRAITYLKYEDVTTLSEGLKKTWEWAKTQGYQEPVYRDIEIKSDKIPLNWTVKL